MCFNFSFPFLSCLVFGLLSRASSTRWNNILRRPSPALPWDHRFARLPLHFCGAKRSRLLTCQYERKRLENIERNKSSCGSWVGLKTKENSKNRHRRPQRYAVKAEDARQRKQKMLSLCQCKSSRLKARNQSYTQVKIIEENDSSSIAEQRLS